MAKLAISEFQPSMTKRKIVVLAANPLDTSQLRLGKEVAEIQEELQRANLRDEFEFVSHWAVKPRDIQRVLLDSDRPRPSQLNGCKQHEHG